MAPARGLTPVYVPLPRRETGDSLLSENVVWYRKRSSLLRRGGGDARTDDAITFGDLRLEPGTFQLSCGERSLRLSRREYDLLELLLRSQGRVVSKEQLLLKVWGYDSDAEDNNVEVYISFLRRKLTHLHSAVTIRTRRMVGYFLEVEA